MRKRKWQARFRNSIGGVLFGGARRSGRGTWKNAEDVPTEVREYLRIERGKGDAPVWHQRDWKRISAMHDECKPESHLHRNWITVKFTVEEEKRKPRRPLNRLLRQLSQELGVDSLHGIYRSVYKVTPCGPTMGALVNEKWVYCDSLSDLGTLAEMRERGDEVHSLGVGGYVEGWDGECEFLTVQDGGKMPTRQDFWGAVESANNEADRIWYDTHGCDDCFDRREIEGEYGMKPVDADCSTCGGQGAVI